MRRRFTGIPSWETWWRIERSAHLVAPLSAAAVTAGSSPTSGVGASVPGATPGKEGEAVRERLSRERVVPFLLRAVHPSSGEADAVRAAAAISLGRVARGSTGVPVLFALLADPTEVGEVRAAAALGLGLLARSEPERAFSGALLDRVRERLLAAFDDESAPEGVRTASAVALGLLGDQPFGEDLLTRDGRLTVHGIRARLRNDAAGQDVTCSLLAALGMQPLAGVPERIWEDLKRWALRGRASGFSPSAVESEAAALACGRLWGPGAARILERILASTRSSTEARRAAVFALASRCEVLDEEERVEVARILREHMPDARDPVACGVAQITLGRLVAAELRAAESRPGAAQPLARSDIPAYLLQEASSGPPATRPFSAFALALACRESTEDGEADTFRKRARDVLLSGATRENRRSDLRGAYLAALGLWPRARPQEELEAVVADRTDAPDLRGYGVVALAQTAWKQRSAERAVGIALADHGSPELHAEAALAMSLFSSAASGPHLLRELATANTDATRASVVVALAWRRDPAAADALFALCEDPSRGADLRAVSVMALGRLADPEPRSVLTRIAAASLLPPWLAQRVHDALAGI